jgi:NADPH:quinone reductase
LLTGAGRERHGEILRQATRLANNHQLRPLLDPRPFTLANALDAYALIEQRKARGKLVVETK